MIPIIRIKTMIATAMINGDAGLAMFDVGGL
jgi:hypothetical protein